MSKNYRLGGLLLATGIALMQPTGAEAACYGQRYDYYSTPALQEIVGTKIVCAGYPIQYDLPYYTETPWYTITTVGCPCTPPPGGGGNSDPIDWDEAEPGP